MDDAATGSAVTEPKPLFRRIVDFPLVALVFAVLLYALATAIAMAAGSQLPPMAPLARTAIQAALGIGLVFAMYKLAIRHLGEREHDDLPARGLAKDLGLGLLAGAAIFTLVVGLAAAADVYNISGYGGTGDLLRALIAIAIVPAFMEEVLFRGILFRWIEEFGGSWAALFVTSALFGAAHIMNANATWFSSFAIAVEAGLLLGGAYMLTRSLWMPIGLHAAWNFTQGFLFDVPVSGMDQNGLVEARLSGPELLSGGRFGLEASVLALLVATGAGLWLIWLAVKRGQVVQPWWVRRPLAESESEEAVGVDVDGDADLRAPLDRP
jgi:membrane protease YdiL (CAAX protease family)